MRVGRQSWEVRGRGKGAMGGMEGEAGDVRKEGGKQGGNKLWQDDWWITSNKKFTSQELNLWPCKWKKKFASTLADTPYQLNLYSSAELYS